MDRAVVHTEKANNGNVNFIANLPFELIPEGFILALRNVDFSLIEYYANCKNYNESEYYWNIVGLTEDGKPVVVAWGLFDKLEKVLCINRLSIHPHWQSCKKDLMIKIINAINIHSKNIGANTIITITKNPKPYLRKVKGIMRESNSIVLEVIEGVL